MSTDYYRLKKPFTSARTIVGGGHTQLSLWVNHAKAGDITLRNEEVPDVLLALCRNEPAIHVHGIGCGQAHMTYNDDDVEPEMTLISDCGELSCENLLTKYYPERP